MYIATYYEEGKEPVQYTIPDEEYKRLLKNETPEQIQKRMLGILRQSQRRGEWRVEKEQEN